MPWYHHFMPWYHHFMAWYHHFMPCLVWGIGIRRLRYPSSQVESENKRKRSRHAHSLHTSVPHPLWPKDAVRTHPRQMTRVGMCIFWKKPLWLPVFSVMYLLVGAVLENETIGICGMVRQTHGQQWITIVERHGTNAYVWTFHFHIF